MDRKPWDGPATAIVVVLAFVLIGASAPFVPGLLPEAKEFDIAWVAVDAGSGAVATPAAAATPATLALEVSGYTAHLNVTMTTCSDGATPPLQPAATVSWRLERSEVEIAAGTWTCADLGAVQTVTVKAAPDIALREGEDTDSTRDGLWALVSKENETATYRLVVQWDRPAGTLPQLPGIPPPTMSASLDLEASKWRFTVNERIDQEVLR